ncbi:MAG: OstA-like protein [Bacteroidia bacterium]
MKQTKCNFLFADSAMLVLRSLLILCVFLFPLTGLAQTTTNNGGKQIQLKHANSLKGNSEAKYQRLIGDVQFEHQGALLFCDSAHFFSEKNTLEAFGHVHIQQGDSINLWGDFLRYDGNTRKAEVQKNVRLTDGDMTLTTDAIVYDRMVGVASYATGGKIVSKDNTLTSQIGTYTTSSKTLTFKKNVLLQNPQYDMRSDTLQYHPISKIAYFFGPTTITAKNGTKNFIYCENGFYDTNKDIAQFENNAYIITGGQRLKGDSIWYDRKNGIGKAMRNVEIIDTAQRVTIRGGYAVHNEKSNVSLITERALLIQIFGEDSLYLHGDTLKSIALYPLLPNGKKNMADSIEPGKLVIAYHHVRFFKPDLQGRCDSLAWSTQDSTMRLYGDPVLWSGGSQLTAKEVFIQTINGEVKELYLENTAFIISQEDSTRYNQIKGRRMTGYFANNELYKINVEGNGQTLYYAKDQGLLVGVNRADCSRLTIWIKENEVQSISFFDRPDATLYPPLDLPPREALLKDFRWRGNEQPLRMEDVFVH